mmetsp:Transcript_38292/g.62083  ORF Transcript_38292/g.62083 Transcript_38292/m.62083 type:complete len:106 (-) Transcript_38292:495-812(-)
MCVVGFPEVVVLDEGLRLSSEAARRVLERWARSTFRNKTGDGQSVELALGDERIFASHIPPRRWILPGFWRIPPALGKIFSGVQVDNRRPKICIIGAPNGACYAA